MLLKTFFPATVLLATVHGHVSNLRNLQYNRVSSLDSFFKYHKTLRSLANDETYDQELQEAIKKQKSAKMTPLEAPDTKLTLWVVHGAVESNVMLNPQKTNLVRWQLLSTTDAKAQAEFSLKSYIKLKMKMAAHRAIEELWRPISGSSYVMDPVVQIPVKYLGATSVENTVYLRYKQISLEPTCPEMSLRIWIAAIQGTAILILSLIAICVALILYFLKVKNLKKEYDCDGDLVKKTGV